LILLLFAASYPYDASTEQTFLEVEIHHLQQVFERVILVPRKFAGIILPLPDGVEVDESYASLLDKIDPLTVTKKTIFSSLLYNEIASFPKLLFYPQAIKRLLAFLVGAQLTRDWVVEWLRRSAANQKECIFYTYWFDQGAYGIGLAKQDYSDLRLVSRIHGYDLYEEFYYRPPYWPRRRAALSLVDRLFPDSEAGLTYLKERYPEYAQSYELALLGVSSSGFITLASSDNIFRIVSCSMLEPVKRVDLLIEGIASAARVRPDQHFEWRHFGNGARREELQALANRSFPSNAKGELPGYSSKADLMRYYEQNSVDVFVNVSATEGTPVAVMEAVSCGIPVIATSVGGNVEIVSEQNGLLLDPDPTPEQIGQTLLAFWDDKDAARLKRQGSFKVWQERYNADANFRAFAEKLRSIRQS
jgi:glycosyltransferase involved in cell wall biosynthesis